MEQIKIVKSIEDNSVNFINNEVKVGFFESRYVRRGDDYFIVYLSIQSGCDLACRMCHLTATKQKKYVNNTIDNLVNEARVVIEHYKNLVKNGIEKPAHHMHFNFMARGEALNSEIFKNQESAYELLSKLRKLAEEIKVSPRFLVSTIMPESFSNNSLIDSFKIIQPYIYYSLYSTNKDFRKIWLSKAMEVDRALEKLSEWNKFSDQKPKIHYAFIEGQNDSEEDIFDICKKLKEYELKLDFNIVRYNPYSEKFGRESDIIVIERNAKIIREELNSNVKIIPRVGRDVKASCGMFIEKE